MHTADNERLPMIPREQLDAAQQAAADELIAGPRKAVKGPFIPLLRSPTLLGHVQRLGAFLRFETCLPTRLNEFATLVVSRHWTQHFEWHTHVPLALKAGVAPATIDALREGRRPETMAADEALVHDLVTELQQQRGLGDGSYARALAHFGERGVVELTSLVGYFTMVSMLLNVAHTPAEPGGDTQALPALPR
jgi:4-carboxymuconolactone decarboxylase